jgi:hypothetical protein
MNEVNLNEQGCEEAVMAKAKKINKNIQFEFSSFD